MIVFGTYEYHGASTIRRRAFDWKRSRISTLDVEAVPELDSISPDRFQNGFVEQDFVAEGEQ
jgi:hypothetical protein